MPSDTARGSYSTARLAARLGLTRSKIGIAQSQDLIPPPDLPEGRWSAIRAQECIDRAHEIRSALGDDHAVGACLAAQRLAVLVGLDVSRSDVEALVVSRELGIVGLYQGNPLYSVRELGALDPAAVTALVRARKGPLYDTVDRSGAADLLGWPKSLFVAVARERRLRIDALGRYNLAEVQALARDPALSERAQAEHHAIALKTTLKDVAKAEEHLADVLGQCTTYLTDATAEMPVPVRVGRALRALAAARRKAAFHHPALPAPSTDP